MSADLADIIRAYWRQRGCAVDVGVREVTQPGVHGHTYDYRAVRSDMVNGLPRGYRGDEARSYAVPDGPQLQEGRPLERGAGDAAIVLAMLEDEGEGASPADEAHPV